MLQTTFDWNLKSSAVKLSIIEELQTTFDWNLKSSAVKLSIIEEFFNEAELLPIESNLSWMTLV